MSRSTADALMLLASPYCLLVASRPVHVLMINDTGTVFLLDHSLCKGTLAGASASWNKLRLIISKPPPQHCVPAGFNGKLPFLPEEE